ncbi:cupin domain-containing protein [uncultured Meiothermus sp.]|jgi:quercetin dioxygenase-like cupin family protein|uniref:cupin domain-containing protein n=1 Tax=uncultured Meiothermus sp. TaxID=157471 RepID=UPI002624C1AD|nr:cupin domain-containing protein [uncultured Meiothermus sp.]
MSLQIPDLERCYWCAGLFLQFLAESGDTDGSYTLIDSVIRKGTEPPPHVHTFEDEELFLLEGQLRYRFASAGGGWTEGVLNPGEFVLLSRQREHYFECLTPQVRLLVRLSPGGLEQAFKDFGVAVTDSLLPPPPEAVPELETIARIFEERGVYFVPPK